MEEIFRLRQLYWEALEQIYPSYDFGLVFLQCQPLREKIAKHIKSLIELLESYQRRDFLHRMDKIHHEILVVR